MKLKLGVIGTGMAFERLHYPALQELSDKYEIAALCNRNRKDAEDFAIKYNISTNCIYDDYHKMLQQDDLDAILTAVPIPDNFNVNIDVIKAKKNLIAEKPIAAEVDAAETLAELAKKNGVEVLVAENYRFAEENILIKDLLKQRKIGDVIYFIQNNVTDFSEDIKKDSFAAKEWRHHPEYAGGILLDAGVHDIARMRYLFGNINSIYALGREQDKFWNKYSCYNVQLGFENGVAGHYAFYCDGLETIKPAVGLRIFGSEGEIYLENKDIGSFVMTLKDGTSQTFNYTPERGYYNEFAHFYNVISKGEQSRCSPELETDDIKTIFNILHSIEQKKAVHIERSSFKNPV